MLDRRTFIKAGTCGGATVLAASTSVDAAATNPSKRIIGYYEAEVPQSALKSDAKKIDLSSVDFYRR